MLRADKATRVNRAEASRHPQRSACLGAGTDPRPGHGMRWGSSVSQGSGCPAEAPHGEEATSRA